MTFKEVKPIPSAARRIRLAMICQRDDLATGGAARVAVELAKRLTKHRIEVTCIFVYGKPGGISRDIRSQSRWLGIESRRQVMQGLYCLKRELKDIAPDIVYHHDGLTWTHLVSSTLRRTLVIGHAHLDGPQEGSSIGRHLAHWVHAHTYRHLVAVSDFTRLCWLQRGFPQDRAIVLRNGVDGGVFNRASKRERASARRRFDLPDTAKVVASVGRLHCGMKGNDDFIRVLKRLGPDWYGLVAGVGPDRGILERLAMELGVENRIRFVDLVDPVVAAYHSADVLAITSHYEPFGLIAVEALASGLPVVGFSCRGGVVEILEDARQKVIGGRNLAAMASAIEGAVDMEIPDRDDLLVDYSWELAASKLAARMHDWVCAK